MKNRTEYDIILYNKLNTESNSSDFPVQNIRLRLIQLISDVF